MGIFKKINFGLTKTRNKMAGAIDDMLDSFDEITDDLYTELEEILVMGDVGVTTAVEITEKLREEAEKGKIKDANEVRQKIKDIISEMLYGGEDMGLITVPSIILVIGVNGVGKTTTIGKMAAMYKAQGKSVILGAADTFRAAAIDQLQIWADRAGVDIIKHKEGADPAAVVFDTINAAKARDNEIIIIDTAGRLHNKKNLMDELNKIYRVIDRELPYSDREVLLVLDSTTGQNAVNQAREFQAVAEITGIVLTKLDGTARGGVVLAIKNELGIPVKFIGVGEQIDDLQPFKPSAFADGLFDKIEYKEEEDISIEIVEESKEELEEVNEDILQKEELSLEDAGDTPEDSETDDTGLQQEEEIEEQAEEEPEKKEKKRRGFFGLFNRNS
ncbi:MAG: signal recognition particle-docking protein FtsY [Clostridia bacterium]|nr:signal recognition particle-docking protein FtsY [Clostridia bacterium]